MGAGEPAWAQRPPLRQMLEEMEQLRGYYTLQDEDGQTYKLTAEEADALGQLWVAAGFIVKSTRRGQARYVSADGSKQYRGPEVKSSGHTETGVQVNFERWEILPGDRPRRLANIHVDVIQ